MNPSLSLKDLEKTLPAPKLVEVAQFVSALTPTRRDQLYLLQSALGDLYHGACHSNRRETSLARIERFLDAVVLLAPDKETAICYGQIAAELAQAGTPIPQNDVWIAALARQTGLGLAGTLASPPPGCRVRFPEPLLMLACSMPKPVEGNKPDRRSGQLHSYICQWKLL